MLRLLNRYAAFALMALLVAALIPASCTSDKRAARETREAPDFALETLGGDPVRLSDYRGKVVLIDFWATWCRPCLRSIPHLQDLHSEYAERGFEVIGVAVGDREETVRNFVDHVGIDYVTCMGNQTIVADYGNFTSIPTAFLVDRDGGIAAQYTGYQDKGTLEKAIIRLLDGEV